jgi:DNA repair exonuclease SbcCD ATPase subunit
LKESGDLKQKMQILQTEKDSSEDLLAKLAAAEAYIVELEQSKNDADAVLTKLLSNMESFRQQSEGLTEDLRKANAEK